MRQSQILPDKALKAEERFKFSVPAVSTETKKLTFADVKQRIGDHLRNVLDAKEFTITSAKLEDSEWKVNVEIVPKSEPSNMPLSASFSIDAFTGEVKLFKRGYSWRF